MNDIRLAQLSMFISKAKELGSPYYPPMVELFDEIMEQRKKVEEMQKALEWYADEGKYYPWKSVYTEEITDISDAEKDKGERARQALKGESQ